MAGRGRPPKPTQLRVLEGNKSKRAIRTGEPEPAFLSKREADKARDRFLTCEAARIYWDYLYPALREARLVTVVDVPALVQWCEDLGLAWRMRVEREKMLADGQMPVHVSKGDSGGYQIHPSVLLEKWAVERSEKAIAGFGGTPAARTKIQQATTQLDLFDSMEPGGGAVVIPLNSLHETRRGLPANAAS